MRAAPKTPRSESRSLAAGPAGSSRGAEQPGRRARHQVVMRATRDRSFLTRAVALARLAAGRSRDHWIEGGLGQPRGRPLRYD
jgi:hypothetical protein